jgi:hypothetical protein
MSDEKATEDFLDAIAAGNFNQAKQWFDGAIQDRVNTALDAEKINVASDIFNNGGDEDLDIEDEIVEDEVEEWEDEDTGEQEGKLVYSGAYEDDESIPEE